MFTGFFLKNDLRSAEPTIFEVNKCHKWGTVCKALRWANARIDVTNIRTVNISYSTVNHADLNALQAFLKRATFLREVKLSFIAFESEDLATLYFLRGSYVEHLELGGFDLEAKLSTVTEVLPFMKRLQTISIYSGGHFLADNPGTYNFEDFREFLECCARNRIWVKFCGANGLRGEHVRLYDELIVSHQPSRLVELDLTGGFFDRGDLPHLSALLRKTRMLRSINLDKALRHYLVTPSMPGGKVPLLSETPEGVEFLESCVIARDHHAPMILNLTNNRVKHEDWLGLIRLSVRASTANSHLTVATECTDFFNGLRPNVWADFYFAEIEQHARKMAVLANCVTEFMSCSVEVGIFRRIGKMLWDSDLSEKLMKKTNNAANLLTYAEYREKEES
jgi:hypothetical protein